MVYCIYLHLVSMVKVGKYTIHESYGLYAIAITGKVIPLYDPKLSHFHC